LTIGVLLLTAAVAGDRLGRRLAPSIGVLIALARAPRLPMAGQHAGPPAPAAELARVHDSAALFFRSQIPGSWVPGYLASRGLSPAVQQHWLAGYALAAWDTLTRHLRSAGYPDALIEAAGLARRSRRGTVIDTFRDRAMLPIRSAQGTTPIVHRSRTRYGTLVLRWCGTYSRPSRGTPRA
jgi:hypothetical protein